MSKTGIFIVGALIAGAMMYQVIARIPTEALNVALGVMCGVAASIPLMVGLLIALTRQRQQVEDPTEWEISDPEPVRYATRGANQVEPQTVQRIPQYAAQGSYAQHGAQTWQPSIQQPQMSYQQMQQPSQPQQQQPQIIVVTPNGQFGQGQLPQGFQMPQWQQQPYPFMQEHANAVDAREWRIIGEE